MQTARRAATSVPYSAQHGVPSHRFFHQLNFGRRTVIGLGAADYLRNSVIGEQNSFDTIKERNCIFLTV